MEELIKSGKYDEARARILAGAAGDADALAVLLEIRDWLRAKEYDRVRKLLERDGDLVQGYLEPAQVQAALQAFEAEDPQALSPYLDDPHLGAEAWCVLGLLRIKAGDPDGANQAFEQALARDPGHFRAKTNQANLLQEMGRVDEAIAIYQDVLKTNPDFALAHHNLGAAYRKKGQLDKSVHHVKRAQRLQLRPPARPQRGAGSASDSNPLPRSSMAGWAGRWWVWVILIVVAYLLLNR